MVDEKLIDEIKKIATDNKHEVYIRSDDKIELVRAFGDQIDSRFTIRPKEDEMRYDFYTEGNGIIDSDVSFIDAKLFATWIKECNKQYEKELYERDLDEED